MKIKLSEMGCDQWEDTNAEEKAQFTSLIHAYSIYICIAGVFTW